MQCLSKFKECSGDHTIERAKNQQSEGAGKLAVVKLTEIGVECWFQVYSSGQWDRGHLRLRSKKFLSKIDDQESKRHSKVRCPRQALLKKDDANNC